MFMHEIIIPSHFDFYGFHFHQIFCMGMDQNKTYAITQSGVRVPQESLDEHGFIYLKCNQLLIYH